MKLHRAALFAVISFGATFTASAQIPNFTVFKRDLPPPDRPDQWITAGGWLGNPGIGATIDAGWFPWGQYATFALAAAAADAWMLDLNGSRAFHNVCNSNWQVYANRNGQQTACGGCTPGNGFQSVSPPMCCIDAMAKAFPGVPQANDCRVVPLRSVPGAKVFWNGKDWVSMTGRPITLPVKEPNKPVIPFAGNIPLQPSGPPPAPPSPPAPRPGNSVTPATLPPIFGPADSVDPPPPARGPATQPHHSTVPPPTIAPPAAVPPTAAAPAAATRSGPVGVGRWALVATNAKLITVPTPKCSVSDGTFQTSEIDSDNKTKQAQITFQVPPVLSSTEDSRLLAQASGNAWASGWFHTGPLKIVKSDYAPVNADRRPIVDLTSGASSSNLELVVRMDPKGPDTFDIGFVVQAYCYGGYPEVVRYTYRRNATPTAAPAQSATAATPGRFLNFESNTTLKGTTLRYFSTGTTPDACQSACAAESQCKAYTYVRAGGYGTNDPPMCYLISEVTGSTNHSCCASSRKSQP